MVEIDVEADVKRLRVGELFTLEISRELELFVLTRQPSC